ncbi:hypothetical protein B5M43_014240 [Microbacterium sp. MEC084]|uniref:hypothetical protein n=1 Tax=Microbacterium sp. MEC084 TaxID=1963027 RepID=UPI00106FA5C1|nr:hypothetical protein [Microbacterium sp. MEC084]MCD1269976.1 hypothetical protein [Microbacterium sp. MEC084]
MTTPDDLVAANRRRARLRRILLWIAVPLAAIALLLPVKILSMYALAHRTITGYVAGDHQGAIAAAGVLGVANWFEPYKAPYDAGVPLAASGRLDEARARFEEALPLAPGLEACAVWIDLGITIEWQGDAARQAGDEAAASRFYTEGLEVVADTPAECHTPEADAASPDEERSADQSIDELEERLLEKQQPPPPSGGGEGEDPPEEEQQPDQPSEEQLQELEDKLTQGQDERENSGDDGQSGAGTDRPW